MAALQHPNQLSRNVKFAVMEIPYLRRLLRSVPGRKRFGVYVFLPVFFALGAGLEFVMINWRIGETNFYETYKKNEAKRIVGEAVVNAN